MDAKCEKPILAMLQSVYTGSLLLNIQNTLTLRSSGLGLRMLPIIDTPWFMSFASIQPKPNTSPFTSGFS